MSRLLCCCVVAAAAVTTVHGADDAKQQQCACAVWIPGVGNWSDPARWSESTVPGLGPDVLDIFVDQHGWQQGPVNHVGAPGSSAGFLHSSTREPVPTSTVFVDLNVQTADVFLGATDELHVLPGRSIQFSAVDPSETDHEDIFLVNQGLVLLDGNGDSAKIVVADEKTLRITGGGMIDMLDPHFSRIEGAGSGESLILDSGTIRGAGRIGSRMLSIENYGNIESTLEFNVLRIQTSQGGTVRNRGVIKAHPWCRVNIATTTVDNISGVLDVDSAAVIELDDVELFGGTITTASDGVVRNLNSPATLQHVVLSGNYETGATQLTLRGWLTNYGTVYAVGGTSQQGRGQSPGSTIIVTEVNGNDFEFAGTGELVLSDAVLKSDGGGATTLINGLQHTIRGTGDVGDDSLAMVNRGVIHADTASPIRIDPADGTVFTNEGTLRASGGACLFMLDGAFANDGVMAVQDGSQLVLLPGASLTNSVGGSLNGGTWIVQGRTQPGKLLLESVPDLSFNLADVTFDGPYATFPQLETIAINSGALKLINGHVFTSVGAFTNTGTLHVGSGSRFESNGRLTLNATSVIELEVGSDGPGQVDATGRINLDGALEIHCTDPSAWVVGEPVEVLHATSYAGSFDAIDAPGPFELTIDNGTFMVTPISDCAMDLNGDSVVNVSDLIGLLADWGTCADADDCPADLNDDGTVNVTDLIELLDNWGACAGS